MSKLTMCERVHMCMTFLMCSEKKKMCVLERVLHDKNKLTGLETILLDLFIQEIRKTAVSMQRFLLEHAQYVWSLEY